MSHLYYGDKLIVLRESIADGSVKSVDLGEGKVFPDRYVALSPARTRLR